MFSNKYSLPHILQYIIFHVSAEISANIEYNISRTQLHHHLPNANQHPGPVCKKEAIMKVTNVVQPKHVFLGKYSLKCQYQWHCDPDN